MAFRNAVIATVLKGRVASRVADGIIEVQRLDMVAVNLSERAGKTPAFFVQ